MSGVVKTAMVLAAGLGKRMRPLTNDIPKPLVKLAGRALIDLVLLRLAGAGVTRAIINGHYKADVLFQHLSGWSRPEILFSDESDCLLDTGGGVVRALPLIGDDPFFVHNSDSVWIEENGSNLERMNTAWDPERMDCLMLLGEANASLGYSGAGDFAMAGDGLLSRAAQGQSVPFVFAGVSIIHPRLFEGMEEAPFSLNRVWDLAISRGRLFGMRLDGVWMHVGSPSALIEAEQLMSEHTLGQG